MQANSRPRRSHPGRQAIGRYAGAMLAVLAVLLGTVVSVGAQPAVAAAPGAEIDTWTAILQITNDTPLTFRLLDSTKTEMSNWNANPRATMGPGEGYASAVKNTVVAFGHGIAQLATYAAYDNNEYVGMIVVSNGIDCDRRVNGLCLDYSRWQRYWASPLAGRFKNDTLQADFVDGAGPPIGYRTVYELHLTPKRPPHPQTTQPAADQVGYSAAQIQQTQQQLGLPTGGRWGWTQHVANATPFTLQRAFMWNSQGTNYLGGTPPEAIPSGANFQYLYGNSVTLHGPQAFVVYDAIDPTTKAYIGSVVVEAQTDCNLGVKVVDIPTTCLDWHVASYSVAASIPGTNLESHSETTGLQPFSLIANTVVRGEIRPPEPTPTTEPAKTATAVKVLASSPQTFRGQPVTFTAGVTTTNPSGPVPTGTVDFFEGTTKLGSGTLSGSGGKAEASLAVSDLAIGTRLVTAVYAGDPTTTGSRGELSHEVLKAKAELTLTPSANPSPAGAPLSFAVSVTTTASSTPTGEVTVTDDGDSANRFTVTLDHGRGIGTFPRALGIGIHHLYADWNGGPTEFSSASKLDQVIQGANPTVTAVTASTTTPAYQQQPSFSATVTSAGTPVSGGWVRFELDEKPYGRLVPLVNGQATTSDSTSFRKTPLGAHTFTATFVPDTTPPSDAFAVSSGSVVGGIHVSPSPTHIRLDSPENPSKAGSSVTFWVSVFAKEGWGEGSLVFSIDGKRLPTVYQVVDGNVTLVLGPEYSRPGRYTLSATFTPADNRFLPSTSETITQEVDPAGP
jgi:hypothetical protein